MKPLRFTLVDLGAVVFLTAIGLGALVQPRIPQEYDQDFQAGRQAGRAAMVYERQNFKNSLCMENLRKLAQAAQLYATENKGRYPGANPWAKGPGWDELLALQLGARLTLKEMAGDQEYARTHAEAKLLSVFICPCDPNRPAASAIVRSYALNLGSAKDFAPDVAAIVPANPSESVFLAEFHQAGSRFGVRSGNYTISQGAGATATFASFKEWSQVPVHGGGRPDQPSQARVLMYNGAIVDLDPHEEKRFASRAMPPPPPVPPQPVIAQPMEE